MDSISRDEIVKILDNVRMGFTADEGRNIHEVQADAVIDLIQKVFIELGIFVDQDTLDRHG